MEAKDEKLVSLKHHIDKMELFSQYFRDLKVADRYLQALEILRDELFEAVDV